MKNRLTRCDERMISFILQDYDMEGVKSPMSRITKKICPVTVSDEIIITHPNPEELVITQRKTIEGKYERVLRPRKEAKGGLLPTVNCPSLGHPALDAPSPLGTQLWKEGKAWCRKTKKMCPMEQIIQDLV